MPERKDSGDAIRIRLDTGENDNSVMVSQQTSDADISSCGTSPLDVAEVEAQPQVHHAWWDSAHIPEQT